MNTMDQFTSDDSFVVKICNFLQFKTSVYSILLCSTIRSLMEDKDVLDNWEDADDDVSDVLLRNSTNYYLNCNS